MICFICGLEITEGEVAPIEIIGTDIVYYAHGQCFDLAVRLRREKIAKTPN